MFGLKEMEFGFSVCVDFLEQLSEVENVRSVRVSLTLESLDSLLKKSISQGVSITPVGGDGGKSAR